MAPSVSDIDSEARQHVTLLQHPDRSPTQRVHKQWHALNMAPVCSPPSAGFSQTLGLQGLVSGQPGSKLCDLHAVAFLNIDNHLTAAAEHTGAQRVRVTEPFKTLSFTLVAALCCWGYHT